MNEALNNIKPKRGEEELREIYAASIKKITEEKQLLKQE